MIVRDMMGETITPDIQELPPFSSLPVSSRRYLQSRLKRYQFSAGDMIIQEGKRGQFWALVGYGLVDLETSGSSPQTLMPGQMFGQEMVCEGAPSLHSAMARSEAGLWVITRKDWLWAIEQERAASISRRKKTSRGWVWVLSFLILIVFTVFFLGPNLLFSTNQFVVESMLNAGRTDLAEQYLRFSIRWQPKSAVLYDTLGYMLFIQGKQTDALKAFEMAISLDDQLASAQNNLGVVKLGQWQTTAAIDHLGAAVELDPGNAEAYYNLGNAYLAAGETRAAGEAYQRAFELDPDRIDAKVMWAGLQMDEGDLPAARRTWEEVLEEAPDHALAHRGLGAIAVLEEQPEQALPELLAAMAADPNDAVTQVYLGLALVALEKPEDAAQAFEAALTLTNDPALILLAESNLQEIRPTSEP